MASEPHRPAAVIDALRAIFVVDKLPIGFLIGAGCPSAVKAADDTPLIPDAKGLTKAVLDGSPDLASLFKRLQDMLLKDGQENPTIEHMLTRVRTMETIVGKEQVRGFTQLDLQRLEKSICQTISNVAAKTLPASTPYHSLARWIRQRTNRSVIFTTNYDLLIEQALETLQVPFFDGFIGSYRPFFDQRMMEHEGLPPQWALVCKLHGSINWRLVSGSNDVVQSLDDTVGDQVLIHPSHLKYAQSRRMPYFVMLDQLKTFIGDGRRPAALFAIGYSFSDEHINDTIADGLRANPSAVCYAIQYDQLSAYPQVLNLVQRCSNLHVLASDQAVTDGRRSTWQTCSRSQMAELGGTFRPSHDGVSDGSVAEDDDPDSQDMAVEFGLGDFNAFGHFLGSLSAEKSAVPARQDGTPA